MPDATLRHRRKALFDDVENHDKNIKNIITDGFDDRDFSLDDRRSEEQCIDVVMRKLSRAGGALRRCGVRSASASNPNAWQRRRQ